MKTTILLSLILASNFLVSCLTPKEDRYNNAEIVMEVINSTLDSIKNTVYFQEDQNDSIFVVVNNNRVIVHYFEKRIAIEVPVKDISLSEQRSRFIDSDTIFTNLNFEDVIQRQIKLESYYFVEFDSIHVNQNNVKAKVSFGPLGFRNYYYHYYDKDSFKIINSELIVSIIK